MENNQRRNNLKMKSMKKIKKLQEQINKEKDQDFH